jgi:hypothetical protein
MTARMSKSFIEVRPSPISGRGLFATQDLEPYSRVFTSPRPLVYAIDNAHIPNTCAHCFKTDNQNVGPGDGRSEKIRNKACTGCRYVSFCSTVGSIQNL